MKKILYLITQSELGGAQRYCFDLAKNLKGEFDIAIAFGEQGGDGETARKLKEENIKYYIIPRLRRAISPINDLLALFEIIKLIKKIKPDIIHLNSSKISILGSLACFIYNLTVKSHKLKAIYTVHGWVFNEPLPLPLKLFYKYAEKFTAGLKDKIICVSEFDRQTALKEKIAPAEKFVTIRNGIEPIKFLSRDEARQKLFSKFNPPTGGQNSKLIIGAIGNLYKTKGYEYLIKAAKFPISNFQFPISFIIIGDGPERKNLEELIKKHGLENIIILAGRIDNAAELLPAFDIYACSSVKEGLSYTIMEAMQAGLPIIATRVGGNPELIEDEKTGILVEPRNPEMLAEKIKILIDDHELAKKLGANAKIKTEKEFALEEMIKKTERVYNNFHF